MSIPMTPGPIATALTNRGTSGSPRDLRIAPIPMGIARDLIAARHYLRSFPGGTKLSIGVFDGSRLVGALTLGAGPANGHQLVRGARRSDCITLTRVWLSGTLLRNSASRVLGLALRALKAHTSLKVVITYADPDAGHVGTIYQATNWLYTGLSQAGVLMDLGDGVPRHTRTLGYVLGTHSMRKLRSLGIKATPTYRPGKYRYVYFLDPNWRSRLRVPILPYPKGDDL